MESICSVYLVQNESLLQPSHLLPLLSSRWRFLLPRSLHLHPPQTRQVIRRTTLLNRLILPHLQEPRKPQTQTALVAYQPDGRAVGRTQCDICKRYLPDFLWFEPDVWLVALGAAAGVDVAWAGDDVCAVAGGGGGFGTRVWVVFGGQGLVEFIRKAGHAFGHGGQGAGFRIADGDEDRGPPGGFAALAVPGGDGDEVEGFGGGGVVLFDF